VEKEFFLIGHGCGFRRLKFLLWCSFLDKRQLLMDAVDAAVDEEVFKFWQFVLELIVKLGVHLDQ